MSRARAYVLPLAAALMIGVPMLGACSDSGESDCSISGTERTFGECCREDSQCASGVCHLYGDGTQACTESCSSDDECPEGSQGKKCNNQGVCRI